jgi:7-carboxy-7-deazaguanine synthase
MTIPINEVFETIQGEAHWTGTPAVFIRLQFCDVGCPWCDTKHTWAVERDKQINPETMLKKDADANTFARMEPAVIVRMLERFKSKHVVLTGGEPCSYDLLELTGLIRKSGRRVQIETSGTYPISVHRDTWITVSPKIGMPGGREVRADSLVRADEIKMPVGKNADIEKLETLLKGIPLRRGLVWLQPLSQSAKATEICVQAARERDWRISIQTHKFIGVR